MSALIQLRSDSAANWASNNTVLADAEMGWAKDTGVMKIGNGTTPWLSLPNILPNAGSSSVTLTNIKDPGPADPDKLVIYSKKLAGRSILKIIGSSGRDVEMQAMFGRNRVGAFMPVGNATTLTVVGSYTTPTAVGIVSGRNVSTNNLFTRCRRMGWVSAATINAIVSLRVGVAQVTTGGVPGSGFFTLKRFGISDAVIVPGARMFVGVRNLTTAPTNVDLTTLTNCIGVGHNENQTNLSIFYGGSVAQTPINLGPDFPVTESNTDIYEFALYAPPASESVFYEVSRLNTGHTATGVLTPNGGLALPTSNMLLSYMSAWRTNHASTGAVGLDIMGDYIETDF